MKKQFFRVAAVRRVVSKFVLTSFIVVSCMAVHAQAISAKQEIKTVRKASTLRIAAVSLNIKWVTNNC